MASTLVTSGVILLVSSGIGLAPYDALLSGIAGQTGMPFGLASLSLGATLLTIATVMGRGPTPSTLAFMTLNSVILIIGIPLAPELDSGGIQGVAWALGFLLLTCGVATMVVGTRAGGPLELIMLAVADRGLNRTVVWTVIELTMLGVAAMLGGSLGLGTVMFAVGVGPAVSVFGAGLVRAANSRVGRATLRSNRRHIDDGRPLSRSSLPSATR
jgi:uncharacterized membrane protein YczE